MERDLDFLLLQLRAREISSSDSESSESEMERFLLLLLRPRFLLDLRSLVDSSSLLESRFLLFRRRPFRSFSESDVPVSPSLRFLLRPFSSFLLRLLLLILLSSELLSSSDVIVALLRLLFLLRLRSLSTSLSSGPLFRFFAFLLLEPSSFSRLLAFSAEANIAAVEAGSLSILPSYSSTLRRVSTCPCVSSTELN